MRITSQCFYASEIIYSKDTVEADDNDNFVGVVRHASIKWMRFNNNNNDVVVLMLLRPRGLLDAWAMSIGMVVTLVRVLYLIILYCDTPSAALGHYVGASVTQARLWCSCFRVVGYSIIIRIECGRMYAMRWMLVVCYRRWTTLREAVMKHSLTDCS